jgi:DNA-binding CsgD family transcriptional regulator
MIVVSAAGSDERLNLGTRDACAVVNSIGTGSYGDVCFAMLESALNAEHWALFRFRSGSPLKCVATASKRDKAAAKENCERFVGHCYSVDPSVKVASTRRSSPTLTKMAIDDIEDPQYRQCFELTHVQERVSLFSWVGLDLYQLSVFRGPRKASFSAFEMNHFAALAKLLLATAQKHEMLVDQQTSFPRHLNIEGIERLLKLRSPELSTRECEVCARAVAGKTIEGTSLELDIKRTSVITYRQRAYQKLGISRTNELVALLSNLHAERSLAS